MPVKYTKSRNGAYPVNTIAPDDYYTAGAKEPPGIWWHGLRPDGSRATTFGVLHGVKFGDIPGHEDVDRWLSLAQGFDPETGAALVQNAGKKKRIQVHDFTFTISASVSTVWALASPELHADMDRMQLEAVSKAADFISSKALTRRGHAGHKTILANMIGGMFQHGSSRLDEPMQHIHFVSHNVAEGIDGTTGALETKHILSWMGAASSIYHAHYGWLLASSGASLIVKPNGLFEIEGVPKTVIEALTGSRRREIKEIVTQRLLAQGWTERDVEEVMRSNRKIGDIVAGASRKGKSPLTREQLHEIWDEVGRQHGFTAEQVDAVFAHETMPVLTRDELLEEARKAVEGLMETDAFYREQELTTKVANYLTGRASCEQILQAVEDVKPELLQTRDYKHESRMFYTSKAFVDIEVRMLERSATRDPVHAAQYIPKDLPAINGIKLDPEQEHACRTVLADDRLVSVVMGSAGAGKSTMAAALNAVFTMPENRSRKVIATSSGWAATKGLKKSAQMAYARAITGMVNNIRKGKITIDENTVIVMDEAGLVGSKAMSDVIELAHQYRAKVVLLGDTLQQKAVAAGDPMRCIAQQNGCTRIDEIRRQYRTEDREAVHDLFAGRTRDGLAPYVRREYTRPDGSVEIRSNIHVREDKESTRSALVEHWMRSRAENPGKEHLIIASEGETVREINRRAHEARKAAGELGASIQLHTMECEENDDRAEFSVGDRVTFRVNERRKGLEAGEGITNRTHGVLVDIDGPVLRIKTDEGQLVDMDTRDEMWQAKDGDGKKAQNIGLALVHGYCSTNWSAQGATAPFTFVADSVGMDRAAAGVACSRHREDLHIYVDKSARWEAKMLRKTPDEWQPLKSFSDQDCLDHLVSGWSSERHKGSTLDFAGEWEYVGGPMVGVKYKPGETEELKAIEAAKVEAEQAIERIREASKTSNGLLEPLPFQKTSGYVLPKPEPKPAAVKAATDKLEAEGISRKVLEQARENGFVDFDKDGRLVALGYRGDGALVHVADGEQPKVAPALRHRFAPILHGDSPEHLDVVKTGKEALALRSTQVYRRELGEQVPLSTIVVNAADTDEALRMPQTSLRVKAAQFLDRAAAAGRDLLQECREFAQRVADKIAGERETAGVGKATKPGRLAPPKPLPEIKETKKLLATGVTRLRKREIDDEAIREAHKARFLRIGKEGQPIVCGRDADRGDLMPATDADKRAAGVDPRHVYAPILPGTAEGRVHVVATGLDALALRSMQLRDGEPTSTVIVNTSTTKADEALKSPHVRALLEQSTTPAKEMRLDRGKRNVQQENIQHAYDERLRQQQRERALKL